MPTLDAATLPLTGRQLIEASAGTGKTYNITRLYIRLLLESNLGVDRILVMTFTKAATEELRGRLATLLREAHDHWDTLDEPFFAELRQRIDPVKAKARLYQALLHLDEAAVYTIHGFCKRALTQQAFASGIGFNAEMETDSRELIMEALRDWYRRRAGDDDFGLLYQHWPTPDAFFDSWANTIASSEPLPEPGVTDPEPAWQAFREQWDNEAEAFFALNVKTRRGDNQAIWQATLDELNHLARQTWPGSAPELFDKGFNKDAFSTAKKIDQLPTLHRLTKALNQISLEQRAQLAWAGIDYARAHLADAKDRLNQLDFNDLIVLLRKRLTEDGGEPLAAALAEQFPAALVDEFQDTDPDQYAILDTIYRKRSDTEPLLCMIGDPKQAIYGFRGGDVFAYLSARDHADQQWQMDTNFRSHPAVVDGYNQLFYDGGRAVFGFGIDYQPVNAGAKEPAELIDPAGRAAVQWGLLPADDKPYTKDAQGALALWSAAEIHRLLTQASWSNKPVQPGDIAILVRDRNEAATIQLALHEYGLNSVYLSSRDNVLKSEEADSLRLALHGILDLENDRALVAALATPWFGLDTEALFELHQNEHRWAELQAEVTELRERWLNQGLMSMALALFQRHVQPRPEQHERALTNSLHLLELLQQASQHHRQPWALLHWFDQARDDDRLAAEAQLRMESDADLIQVITQHGAKGLEYPIVFLPFVSYGRSARQAPALVRYHDRHDHSARLALNPSDEEIELWQQEQIAEDIRLLYVAATRAESRLYILAAEFKEFARSPLARCMGIEQFGTLTEKLGTNPLIPNLLRDIALTTEQPSSLSATPRGDLKPADFHGSIERDWWLSSFSALTRNARHGGLSNPDRDQDEPEATNTPASELPLRFSLARGAEAGNLLHDILERLDFHQPDFEAALQAPRQRYQGLISGIENAEPQLIDWLTEILHTELPSGARLADLPLNQTLRESEFYFPLNATANAGRLLADILARHRGQQAVALPDPRRLKGMMHGYIDLVYQWGGRYYVVDYKSSYLGNQLARYQDPWLTESVQNSYYDLQYLIYSLALHRYLKTRLADYDPAQHLGGVHYLYLRGMAPGNASGIYHREADLTAIAELDALFQGEEVNA
ncbi:exodeoxyribonuclease V subunit beta [Saccharospirillum sp. MSK14-1]|uniref:exodeoxyribonuclease V subunit beta n=1 Tax=Saccharospirillum sp. MSK14-1 TaxID=1897632 RepID=UPI000D379A3D|nr:exodeoxyribonuclease V subunit beta [Saccharospirillum sp. MSK14-1]PTY37705.1 exodeoxyribonuclease V subunit beta [Saccharospirillum sp. MSK14-1]